MDYREAYFKQLDENRRLKALYERAVSDRDAAYKELDKQNDRIDKEIELTAEYKDTMDKVIRELKGKKDEYENLNEELRIILKQIKNDLVVGA